MRQGDIESDILNCSISCTTAFEFNSLKSRFCNSRMRSVSYRSKSPHCDRSERSPRRQHGDFGLVWCLWGIRSSRDMKRIQVSPVSHSDYSFCHEILTIVLILNTADGIVRCS